MVPIRAANGFPSVHLGFTRFHDDGERYVYSLQTSASGVDLDEAGHWDLKHANPDWSPDGREIAFVSRRDGTDIWIAPSEGGEPRRLTTDPAVAQAPAWSPDGKWVAFHSLRGDVRRHWRIPAEGGEAEPVNESGEGKAVWSHDGTQLFYGCYSLKKICAIPIETGEERILADLEDKKGHLGLYGRDADRGYVYFGWQQVEGDIWVTDVVKE